jgi:hypothetical protein
MKLPVLNGEKQMVVQRKSFSLSVDREQAFSLLIRQYGCCGGANLKKKINLIFLMEGNFYV